MFCTALVPGSFSLHHPQDVRRGSPGGCWVLSWVLSRPRGIGTTGNPPPQPQAPGGRRSRSRRKVLQEAHPQERARGANNPPPPETPARPCSETPGQGAGRGKKCGSGLG